MKLKLHWGLLGIMHSEVARRVPPEVLHERLYDFLLVELDKIFWVYFVLERLLLGLLLLPFVQVPLQVQ